MNATFAGTIVGAVLALTLVTLGFWPFLLVSIAMLIGAGIGRIVQGRLDLSALVDVIRGRRTSS